MLIIPTGLLLGGFPDVRVLSSYCISHVHLSVHGSDGVLVQIDAGDGGQQALDPVREVSHRRFLLVLLRLLHTLFLRGHRGSSGSETSPLFKASDHEVNNLIVVVALVDVAADGGEGLVEDGHEHVDEDEGDSQHKEEHVELGEDGLHHQHAVDIELAHHHGDECLHRRHEAVEGVVR